MWSQILRKKEPFIFSLTAESANNIYIYENKWDMSPAYYVEREQERLSSRKGWDGGVHMNYKKEWKANCLSVSNPVLYFSFWEVDKCKKCIR